LRRSSADLDDRVRAAARERGVLARGRGRRRQSGGRDAARRLSVATRVAITGASGQLGRRTAELVLAQREPRHVILATRAPDPSAYVAAGGADCRYADVDAPASSLAAFAGAERVLLISATDLQRRVSQHEAALTAAKAVGVRPVIYPSGSEPAPPNPAAV